MLQEMLCGHCERITRFVAGDGFEPRCTMCGYTRPETLAAAEALRNAAMAAAAADTAPPKPTPLDLAAEHLSQSKESRVWLFVIVSWAVAAFAFFAMCDPLNCGSIAWMFEHHKGVLLFWAGLPAFAAALRLVYVRLVR